MPPHEPRLLDQVRHALRTRHYSRRTEAAYVAWNRRFIAFHGMRHPQTLDARAVSDYLSALAVNGGAASMQNQALGGHPVPLHNVLGVTQPELPELVLARTPQRLPVVLSRGEVASLLAQLRGIDWLTASLLYGSGLRLTECVELRLRDVHFDREVLVRDGKGGKDRDTMLPASLHAPLAAHLAARQRLHARDLACSCGSVWLPDGLRRKYPNAALEWAWQWVLPATRHYRDAETRERRRHHLHESVLQRAVKEAARHAGIPRLATCHTRRHSFATHLLESAYDIRTIQELLGHRDVSTTTIYTHVLNQGGRGVRSPLDVLGAGTVVDTGDSLQRPGTVRYQK